MHTAKAGNWVMVSLTASFFPLQNLRLTNKGTRTMKNILEISVNIMDYLAYGEDVL